MGLNIKGWIYILSNESFPHLVKIGYSERDPQFRLSELYTTGIPTQFKIEYSILVDDAYEVEKIIHEKLIERRHSTDREFFKIPVINAIEIVKEILSSSNKKIYLQDDFTSETDNLLKIKQSYINALDKFIEDLLDDYNRREKHYLQIFDTRHDFNSSKIVKSRRQDTLNKLQLVKKEVTAELEKFIAEISGTDFAIDILEWYIEDADWKIGSKNFYDYLEKRFTDGNPYIFNIFKDINSFDYTQLLKD